MEYTGEQERIIESDDADGGWVETHHGYSSGVDDVDDKVLNQVQLDFFTLDFFYQVAEMTLDSHHSETNAVDFDEDDDDDEAVDLEEFEARGCFDDSVSKNEFDLFFQAECFI